MKIKLITLYFFCYTLLCSAQNQNSIWCFGDSSGINFSNLNNPISFASAMDGRGSCASIADSVGNLLFYTNTFTPLFAAYVWTAAHDTMPNGVLLSDGAYNELQIIPFPDGQNKFYIFHCGAAGFVDGLFYSIVDMSLNGGLGQVTLKNQHFLTNVRVADCLQAAKHANGRDWWLITKIADSNLTTINRFIVYLITPAGISTPTYFDFGGATDMDFQKIIFNNSYTKVMNINLLGYMAEYNFDRCSGIISNQKIIYPEINSFPYDRYFWEGSYSPNDSLFYATTNTNFGVDFEYLLQYDLTASYIPGSCDTIDSTTVPIGPGAVRLAPNGKIYYSRAYENSQINSFPYKDTMYNYINMNLSVINYPDSSGASCDFQPFSFYLGGKRTYYGLPNNPKYDLGPLIGSQCDTLTFLQEYADINFSIFPNPVKDGSFQISFTKPLNKSNIIEIFDVIGRKVFSQTLPALSTTQQIILPRLRNGLYNCVISLRNNRVSKKIIVLDDQQP